jgi:magnesium-transporting ATPase (P-type)
MRENDDPVNQTYSYLALRKSVGWIGILLPFVLMAGVLLIFNESDIPKNISLYYHSGMRDVFVGALCAIALFLFFYRGYSKMDNLAGNLAGFFALGIALFPTVREGPYNISAIIHFICAVSFFIILAVFSMFLFTKKETSPTRQKLNRNRIYILCGSVMILCLIAIAIFFLFLEAGNPRSKFVFWAETLALTAFGISWLTKGCTFYPDKEPGKD